MSDIRRLVRRQFGAHAERYVASAEHSLGESLDRMLEVVGPRAGWRALDVATGGGHTALAFAPRVRRVIASDLTIEMLAAARRFIQTQGAANVSFAAADACDLPFADGAFDLVTCRVAPHHFPDCGRFVREMARVLTLGGVAAVIDNVVPDDAAADEYVNAFERLRDPSHVRAHTQAEWLGFFAGARLEVRHVEEFRKVRDFAHWSDIQSVDAGVKARLRAMLEQAPPGAREALGTHSIDGKLKFFLTEVLLVGRRRALGG